MEEANVIITKGGKLLDLVGKPVKVSQKAPDFDEALDVLNKLAPGRPEAAFSR
ncbi:MAG: hypothetical protein Q7R57_05730 [Dehalococcoidales bacterium]|nr:hypothetical protein [Dehalococcoidales bacterium]